MKFARIGGLSSVKYNGGSTRNGYKFGKNSFHSPPEKKGIYAFIWPYIEPFLVCWSDDNCREWKYDGLRKFSYGGLLYAHLGKTAFEKGSWGLIHTDDLKIEMKKLITTIYQICLKQKLMIGK